MVTPLLQSSRPPPLNPNSPPTHPPTPAAEIPQRFPDGVFAYPESCATPRCKNRLFELLRDTAETVDFQKIKVGGLVGGVVCGFI